jgi:phosphoglycolate phosphatase-like HAD superfamily hydrolase
MEIEHIVWDWNGTLFDDGDALVLATIDAFAAIGITDVTRQRYQDCFTRPIQDFYDLLAGRTLTPGEQTLLDEHFQHSYARRLAVAKVHSGAVGALTAWRATGRTQSLLSMYPHDQLVALPQLRAIAHFFTRVDGMSVDESPRKQPHLRRHLAALGTARVLVVGDSNDDVAAARACGVRCVLYHPRERALLSQARVAGLSVPVARDLPAAVALASDDYAINPT